MKHTIADTEKNRQIIQKLMDDDYYTGSFNENGFILKRNYGIRRLPVYGSRFNSKFEITVKNELLHQILYVFAYILILSLSLFLLFKGDLMMAFLILLMIMLVILADRQRKKMELEKFLSHLS